MFTIPLIVGFVAFGIILSLAGISGMFSERVGIVNIGINGTMIIGALSYAIYARFFDVSDSWIQIILIPLAALTAMIFSWLHGYAAIKLKADHVISGIAINGLALGISLLLMKGLGDANKLQHTTQELALSEDKSSLGNIFSLKLIILIIVVIASIFFLNKTKWGLRFKAVGENPQAVDSAGINVYKMKWLGISISGFLAGLAGAIYSQYVGGTAFNGDVAGLGFLALAIMIMGQWKTSYIIIAAFCFALVYQFSARVLFTDVEQLQWVKKIGELLLMTPYIVTIIFLAVFSKKSKAPKAAGITYDKSIR